MFTGIIEATGRVEDIQENGTNRSFWIASSISTQFKVDQSISHSGACLTIEVVGEHSHRVTAIQETLNKTNLGEWKIGSLVNLERCLTLEGRLEGHLVQGHVDTTAECLKREDKGGSWEFEFAFPKKFGALLIEKGSIAINGISLTAFDVKKKSFRVAIIPYTLEHTNIQLVQPGDTVNIEFDLLGKYILRQTSLHA